MVWCGAPACHFFPARLAIFGLGLGLVLRLGHSTVGHPSYGWASCYIHSVYTKVANGQLQHNTCVMPVGFFGNLKATSVVPLLQ